MARKTLIIVGNLIGIVIICLIAFYLIQNQSGLVQVLIPPGLRKEEIADVLAKNLGWNQVQEKQFLQASTSPDFSEGVYFPDTYLIPRDESPASTSLRLINHFNEEFASSSQEAINQNIKWTTVVTMASIIQREAAGTQDMALIAGIFWNRLAANMRLQADSTVQYARGNTGAGYWAPITPADEQIDSPYNTYRYSGLPPHPISNPGLNAINAVLNPAKTDCIYYLHDSSGMIHCAVTYAEHQANIAKYLQ